MVMGVRHRCHDAPGRTEAIASLSTASQSQVTSPTPFRPRAATPLRNASHSAPSSDEVTSMPRISRLPLGCDAGRDQGVHVHDPAALMDFLR
jgi:hypothetical protein